jgi:hypothetical protein
LKKILLLVVIVFVVFVALRRQRLFLRDPLANVTRDGEREIGAQVYINYSNDVLVENDNPPAYTLVVQHAQHVGTPNRLTCVHWMVCMTDADAATLSTTMNALVTQMTGKLVEFSDAKGHVTQVKLR